MTHCMKGTVDILPADAVHWQNLEDLARKTFALYGYKELRTPIFEATELFVRSIGDGTDIVQKEMYTFEDRAARSVTLRPEGTASVVRSFLQHSLHAQSPLNKLYYIGPMFRYERPQSGRQRQFHQVGVEALGSASPLLDAEVISLMLDFLKRLGLPDITLKLNSIGSSEGRKAYTQSLKDYCSEKLAQMCGDCQQRFDNNVLRLLDCKQQDCQKLLQDAPKIREHLSAQDQDHFAKVCEYLDQMSVPYVLDDRLVRGLDYYTQTVFEACCPALGALDAIGAGGRYDGLVKSMGGPEIPAVGFAFGMERLLNALKALQDQPELARQGLFIVALGEPAFKRSIELVAQLRSQGVFAQMDYEGRSLKAQMRFASKNDFRFALVLGDQELEQNTANLKDLQSSESRELPLDLAAILKEVCP